MTVVSKWNRFAENKFQTVFLTGSKKDSSSSQLKEIEAKLQKTLDENKSFNEKIAQLDDKLSKSDFSVSLLLI